MKAFIVLLAVATSLANVQAQDAKTDLKEAKKEAIKEQASNELSRKCMATGKAALLAKAEELKCKIEAADITVSKADKKDPLPPEFVSYEVKTKCNGISKLTETVAYSNDKCQVVTLPKAEAKPSAGLSDEDLGKLCMAVGKAKVSEQAKAFGCAIDASKIYVSSVDNRKGNPSKYVWYTVKTTPKCAGMDNVTKMVQYYGGKCDSQEASLKDSVKGAIKVSNELNAAPKSDLGVSDKSRDKAKEVPAEHEAAHANSAVAK